MRRPSSLVHNYLLFGFTPLLCCVSFAHTRRWDPKYGTNAEQLRQYTIFTSAPKQEWVEVEKDLFFQISESRGDEEEEEDA